MSHDEVLRQFQQHEQDLQRFLKSRVACDATAADLTQETFLRLSLLPDLGAIENFRSYIFRIAANLAIDHLRRSKLEAEIFTPGTPLDIASLVPGADRELHARQALERIEAALNEMPPKCRHALLCNRLEGQSHAAIAKQLGVSESMVAKYIAQALRQCRDRLREG
jgi:RNA polymerase sigma-70 factor (ECF subfamily)